MTANQCLACGELAVEQRIAPFKVEHNGKVRTIDDRQMFCSACQTISYEGDQISEHERAVASAVREMEGLLSPEDLCRIRAKYRLKQTDLEQMLSVGPKTWTRWERGKVPQSKAADTLIRLIADDPDVARRLMLQAGVNNPEAKATFEQIEADAKQLYRSVLQAELGDRPSPDAERFAERVLDKAFETVRDVHRQAASHMEAA